ncbi:hypothetical protein BC567DRAFT_233732 [Phyllosticta citribraziliensis]
MVLPVCGWPWGGGACWPCCGGGACWPSGAGGWPWFMPPTDTVMVLPAAASAGLLMEPAGGAAPCGCGGAAP